MKPSTLLRDPRILLTAILLVSSAVTISAMRRTSTTFDEIVMIAGGARGFELGKFDLAPEHPPLTQYLYGLPVYLSGPNYPPELDAPPPAGISYRYVYARQFFWRSGNDPERLAFLGRLGAAASALLLVLLAFLFTRRAVGPRAALVAALLLAFLPDLLAHGGVAYNDVPLALAFFAAIWACDAAARNPAPWRGLVAGGVAALAIAVKFSGIAIYPVAALILLAEATTRRRDVVWLRRLGFALLVALIAHYLALVAIYRGDIALEELRYGLAFTFRHVSEGHGAPAYLFGETSRDGWWYFFSVAFLLKTPAAFHALIALGLVGLVRYFRAAAGRGLELAASPLRAPVLGGLVFGAALLASNLHIGFRYALPLLPLICVVIAAGIARLWPDLSTRFRGAVALLLVWHVASALSYYPHFLAYTSEYIPGRDSGHEALVDSSLDWGQGLLELRDYMHEHGIERVYLSYFGSALPEGYGIDYVPLPSFFLLMPPGPRTREEDRPTHLVVSATNLHGVYFTDDLFRHVRDATPEAVLAHTLFVYDLDE